MEAIRPVPAAALGRYAALLCRLDAADRRRRFGRPMDDEAILDHVDALRRAETLVLGAWRGIVLRGAVELARADDAVELALAVAPDARGMGIGRRLFEAALARAGGCAVRLSILADNRIMRAMAARAGFAIRAQGPELLLERPAAGPPRTAAA